MSNKNIRENQVTLCFKFNALRAVPIDNNAIILTTREMTNGQTTLTAMTTLPHSNHNKHSNRDWCKYTHNSLRRHRIIIPQLWRSYCHYVAIWYCQGYWLLKFTHTHTHTHTHTYVCLCVSVCVCVDNLLTTDTHKHTHTHTHVKIHIRINTHTHTHTRVYTHSYGIGTHRHKHIHRCIHVYTHTHTHTQTLPINDMITEPDQQVGSEM